MSRRWFRPKYFGIGFTPASWEGWAVTVALLLGIGFSATTPWLTPWQHGAVIAALVVAYCVTALLTAKR